jgi:uncharacterized protein YndB with AHSA1/START domain
MASQIQHGYLILADISGYTSFLAGTELEHAQEILSDLLETIVVRFKSLLTISKLEGDAVFAYAPVSKITRGETLLELVESTYVAFRDRREASHRRTTCECNACRATPTLDLKFFIHHGEYFIQTVAGIRELVGSDVNLIHRLLKNHVSEATGWRAYALFTEQGLSHTGLQPDGLHPQPEAYEHLGEVNTYSLNLHPRYRDIVAARRVFLPPEEAHALIRLDFSAPPPVLWEWFNDPRKRGLWMHSEIVPVARVGGRSGPGARNHCVHGKNEVVVEDVLDVRPFDYFTVAHTPRGLPATLLMTYHFTPSPTGGTHLQITFRGQFKSMPDVVSRLMCKAVLQFSVKPRWAFDQIEALIAQSGQLEATH